jgi:MFS family permease
MAGTTADESSPLLADQQSPSPAPSTAPDHVPSKSQNSHDAIDVDESSLSAAQLLGVLSGPYIGGFVVALDSTMIATIAAPISTSFKNLPLLGWLATSFFIASAVSQPLSGKLTDIYGRRTGFVFASAIFTLGNLICTAAAQPGDHAAEDQHPFAAGGAIGPIAVYTMSDHIPLRKRGIWAGFANICFGVGSGIGGPVGGWINDTVGWRAAFAVQVPITALSLVVMQLCGRPPASHPTAHPGSGSGSGSGSKLARVDFVGATLLVLALLAMLLSLISGGNLLPWTSPLVVGGLPLGLTLVAAFVRYEARVAREPIIHVELFAIRTVAAVCANNWFSSMARFAVLFYGPIFLQVQGYSAAQTGLRFVPESVAIASGSVLCGVLMRASGRYYALLTVANLLDVVAFGLICTLSLSTAAWPPFVYLAVMGLSYGSMLTTTLVALIASVSQAQQSIATSASYIFRSTGSVLGITIVSLVFQNVLRPRLREGFGGLEDGAGLVGKIEKDLAFVGQLPDDMQQMALDAYMVALRAVFVACWGMAVMAFLAGLFVERNHTLHKTMSRRGSKQSEVL